MVRDNIRNSKLRAARDLTRTPIPLHEKLHNDSLYNNEQQKRILRKHFKMIPREVPGYRLHSYTGYPTVDEVREWLRAYHRREIEDSIDFLKDILFCDNIPRNRGSTLFEFSKDYTKGRKTTSPVM
jgi:hypothetical protein